MARYSLQRAAGMCGILGGALFATTTLLFQAPAWLDAAPLADVSLLSLLQAAALLLIALLPCGLWARSGRPSLPFASGLLLATLSTVMLAVYLAPTDFTLPARQWAQGSFTLSAAGAPLVQFYGLVPLALYAGWTLLAAAGAREGLVPLAAGVLTILALPLGVVLGQYALALSPAGWHWSFALAQLLGPAFGLAQVLLGLSLWAALPMPRAIPRRKLRLS